MSTATSSKNPRRSFWLRIVGLLALIYFAGYFVLMDRHLPTSPFPTANDYFASSFRWDAKQPTGKGTGPPAQFPTVTIWNVIYRPLDTVFFRVFPRRDAEVERLRELGYYR